MSLFSPRTKSSLFALTLAVSPVGALADDMDVVDAELAAANALAMQISEVSRPVGRITDANGQGRVIRVNGQVVQATSGTVIGLGDVIETGTAGSVNVTFEDESTFEMPTNGRVAVDEFVYDPDATSAPQDFSVLGRVYDWATGIVGGGASRETGGQTPGTLGIRG